MTTEGLGERLARRVPAVAWVGGYRRSDLVPDVAAGLAVTALLIPHGMAYAELAGVPVVTGLYTTVLALLAYAVFGPSRILMLGPDSSLAPLIAAAIVLVGADDDPAQAVATAGMLAVLAGAMCVLAGLTRLGVMADLLSKPVRVGFLNGLAIVMVVGQLPKLFGFSVPSGTTVQNAIDFVDGLLDGDTHRTSLAVGVLSLLAIFVTRRLVPRVPGVLVAVVGATAVVAAFGLADEGVAVVGAVPEGFPSPSWPRVDAGDLPTLLVSAGGLALMTLTDTTALSRGFADRTPGEVDPDREIAALGSANIAAGLFQGFPVSASTTRTTLVDTAGGRTQLVGVVGALMVLVLVVAGGGLVEELPSATLAALVIAAGIQLFDLAEMRWLLAVRRSEFLMSLAATVGVVALGVLEGVGVAILLSLLNFLRRVWRPYDAVLGRVEHRTGYHDVERHPDAERLPGLLIYRFDAPLFFANAEHFARRLRAGIDAEIEPVTHVVVSAEPITDIDTTGAEVLASVLDELDDAGIQLSFAGLKGPVKDRLAAYGLHARIGRDDFYSTLDHAIREYSYETGIEWED